MSSICKYCQQEIGWKSDGGKSIPINADGSLHKPTCKGNAQNKPEGAIIGLLTGYNSGSATFRVKGGATRTYAVNQSLYTAWQSLGFAPDQWIEFTIDTQGFIQPGARNVQQPDWGAELKDPTGGEIKSPFTKASELPKEDGTHVHEPVTPQGDKADCTSPKTPTAETPSDEDRVRAAITKLAPSDRVGARISLAGMVNSVIEIKTTHGKPIDTEEVKREAVALFLWCDSLTTRMVQ